MTYLVQVHRNKQIQGAVLQPQWVLIKSENKVLYSYDSHFCLDVLNRTHQHVVQQITRLHVLEIVESCGALCFEDCFSILDTASYILVTTCLFSAPNQGGASYLLGKTLIQYANLSMAIQIYVCRIIKKFSFFITLYVISYLCIFPLSCC